MNSLATSSLTLVCTECKLKIAGKGRLTHLSDNELSLRTRIQYLEEEIGRANVTIASYDYVNSKVEFTTSTDERTEYLSMTLDTMMTPLLLSTVESRMTAENLYFHMHTATSFECSSFGHDYDIQVELAILFNDDKRNSIFVWIRNYKKSKKKSSHTFLGFMAMQNAIANVLSIQSANVVAFAFQLYCQLSLRIRLDKLSFAYLRKRNHHQLEEITIILFSSWIRTVNFSSILIYTVNDKLNQHSYYFRIITGIIYTLRTSIF